MFTLLVMTNATLLETIIRVLGRGHSSTLFSSLLFLAISYLDE